jgi:SAM-dependent MidA family methyltransferase
VSAAGAFLRDLQNELGGSIPFERFMREALYHPTFGYYSARIHTVGRRGDFSTMATLDRSLAEGIGGWIEKHNARDILEVGAGTGQLALDILASFGWWKRLRLHYHIVEVSKPLRDAQKKLLRGRRVTWHESLPSALDTISGRAHIFSNELVDAFPCRVFERTDTGWQELHVRIEDGRCHEILKPCTIPDSTVFQQTFPVGQRVEVHESYHRWLQDWSPKWKSGAMLTIDYGDTMPGLYHRRPAGSLRGYAAHQVLTGGDIYQAPGRCDLTADVNFSDLETWGNKLGWRCQSQSMLVNFLQPNLPSRFQSAAEAFRVLEQAPSPAIA